MKLEKSAQKALRQFQCEKSRNIEESFARTLSESEKIRLFFINENSAFTDGKNIVVDPAMNAVFADKKALLQVENYLKISHEFSTDFWNALKMLTRGQNIHESLHILYTDFPSKIAMDERATSKSRRLTLASIYNIIEDAFVEAAGCSVFDNLELFLQFNRLATLFCNSPVEGTANQKFREISEKSEREEEHQAERQLVLDLLEYLNYMAEFLLYPMVVQEPPHTNIAQYVQQTKQLFLDGSICGEPSERYTFTQRIFDIIEPIIPNIDFEDDEFFQKILRKLPGYATHLDGDKSLSAHKSKGRTAKITRRLFSDLDGKPIYTDFGGQIYVLIAEYAADRKNLLEIITIKPAIVHWSATEFDCAVLHNKIKIIETKPKPNQNMRRAYQNLCSKYQASINSYNSRFAQLLRAKTDLREEKKIFGNGINSARLSDTKKRYWYKKISDEGLPDIAIMLLIDGSGSMAGGRRNSAITSSMILHEVLKTQGIPHTIVEHRAGFTEPLVKINIMVSFGGRADEKLNIMSISAKGDNRDGLALFWAERYIKRHSSTERRLIISVADGQPAHKYDNYYPPVSAKDTANAAAKIIKRGTDIVAVALDDSDNFYCYDALKEIYPTVVACTDLRELTGQLLGIVSRVL
ncbi:MAG: hypothetical protein FWG68_11040 [Defluviitaleaceae bacterium]|nr:hypothetical protein [Defluviitaleaceae bacterium]